MINEDQLFFVRDRNRITGPHDIDTLRRFVKLRRLSRHHLVSTNQTSWVKASDALPELFTSGSEQARLPMVPPTPMEGSTDNDSLGVDIGIPATSPEVPVTASGALARLAIPVTPMLVGGMCLSTIAFMIYTLVSIASTKSSDTDVITAMIASRVVAAQGMHPATGRTTMLALPISRNHAVLPVAAAELSVLKIQASGTSDDSRWHGAMLQLADPSNGLAGVRVNLGKSQAVLDVPAEFELPDTDDDVYLAASEDVVEDPLVDGTVKSVEQKGAADQRLIVNIKGSQLPDKELIGRAVLDLNGVLVGIVVGRLDQRHAICATADEIYTMKSELKKLPANHHIDPIVIPSPAQPSPAQPSPAQPSPAQPSPAQPSPAQPSPAQPSPAQPSPAQPSPAQPSPAQPSPAQPQTTVSLIETAGDIGTGLITRATESHLPELSDDTRRDLARQHRDELLEEHPLATDQNLIARVTRLYSEMLRAGRLAPERFALTVTEDDAVNAYSFIGGNLVITTGFMDFAGSDDDMVCFVIAHELGHLQLGHTDLPFRRAQAAGTLGPAGSLAHGVSEHVMRVSPISQAQERDADCYAVRLLRATQRHVDGAVRFFERIDEHNEDRSPAPPDQILGALFGSHPHVDRRLNNILNGCNDRQ